MSDIFIISDDEDEPDYSFNLHPDTTIKWGERIDGYDAFGDTHITTWLTPEQHHRCLNLFERGTIDATCWLETPCRSASLLLINITYYPLIEFPNNPDLLRVTLTLADGMAV